MNWYTQYVLDVAKVNFGGTLDLSRPAWELMQYVLAETDWPPSTDAVPEDWVDEGWQKVLCLIENTWSNPGQREPIRQLAAMSQLGEELINAGWALSGVDHILRIIGAELKIQENWPEMYDVQHFFPRITDFATIQDSKSDQQQSKSWWDRIFGPSDRMPTHAQCVMNWQWQQQQVWGRR